MKVYIVGGAVRDRLLGLPVKDRDFVVVGASPEQMQADGFLPVGRDFPVFLHPKTHEEYALARTERKSGRGYQGFTFHAASDVTLEQDLARRDLTINAIAEDADGSLIDPYDGQRDLRERVFRHVGPAFEEDPVRILRVARFAARFADFSIAPETLAMMRRMVDNGEVDALVPERVWQELARGLQEQQPSRMFDALRACGALAHVAPELDAMLGAANHDDRNHVTVLRALDHAAAGRLSLAQCFAVLVYRVGSPSTPDKPDAPQDSSRALHQLLERLRIPGDCRELALMLAREAPALEHAARQFPDAAQIIGLLERCDALRRPERFEQLLQAWAFAAESQGESRSAPVWRLVARLLQALGAARAVDAGAIAQALMAQVDVEAHPATDSALSQDSAQDAKRAAIGRIPGAVRSARVQAIAASLDGSGVT